MAINYAQLFVELGKIVKTCDQLRLSAVGGGSSKPDTPALLGEVRSAYQAGGRQDLLPDVESYFRNARDSLSSSAGSVATLADSRLRHRDSVLVMLSSVSEGVSMDELLTELARDMVQNVETIQNGIVTIGAVQTAAGNSGNGVVYLTSVLDGVSAPTRRSAANLRYAGLESALAVPAETMAFTCSRDSDTDGTAIGQERFAWEGQPAPIVGPWDWRSEGSGESVDVPCLDTYDILQNRSFSLYSGVNVPSSWDIDDGTPGVHIVQEALAADVFRGPFSLNLVGDGVQSQIRLLQTVSPLLLQPRRRYGCVLWYKGDAGVSAGTLTLRFYSDSGEYVASGSETITLNSATLAANTTWTPVLFELNTPAALPDDLQFEILWSGTPNGSIHLGNVSFGPFVYANGIGAIVSAGNVQFALRDRFTVAVSNAEGVFGRFFRRAYGAQLPFSGTPSIADSLAT